MAVLPDTALQGRVLLGQFLPYPACSERVRDIKDRPMIENPYGAAVAVKYKKFIATSLRQEGGGNSIVAKHNDACFYVFLLSSSFFFFFFSTYFSVWV